MTRMSFGQILTFGEPVSGPCEDCVDGRCTMNCSTPMKPGSIFPRSKVFDVADAAADLVALWENPNIAGLPRQERNAAIEATRAKLIAAVHKWRGVA